MECENCPSSPRPDTESWDPPASARPSLCIQLSLQQPADSSVGDTPIGDHCEPEPGRCHSERPLLVLKGDLSPHQPAEATMPGAWAQRPGKSMPWGLAGSGEGTRHRKGSLVLGREPGLRGIPPVGGQAGRRERLRCWQCWSVCGSDGHFVKRKQRHRRSVCPELTTDHACLCLSWAATPNLWVSDGDASLQPAFGSSAPSTSVAEPGPGRRALLVRGLAPEF